MAAETGIWVTGVVMESKIDLTGLVDTDRVIEVERIDPVALSDWREYGSEGFVLIGPKGGCI